MADYSVDQISKIFNTNPETVRRWIRAGKLKVDSVLPHGAQGISQEALNEFVSTTKEGKRRASAVTTGSSPAVVGGVAVGAAILGFPLLSIAAGIIVDYAVSSARKQKEQVDEEQTVENLKTHLQEEEIRLSQELTMLEQKKADIQRSIDSVTLRLEQYRACLTNPDEITRAVQNELDRRSEFEQTKDGNMD